MGLRYTCWVFPTGDADGFRSILEESVQSLGGHIVWNQEGHWKECLRLGSTPAVQSVYALNDACDWSFFTNISETLNLPVMELRIQDGSLWDYALYLGNETLDTFSTLPQYWDISDEPDEKELLEWAGKPKLIAYLWKVPLERIARYMVNWGWEPDPEDPDSYRHLLDGKAYPEDESTYGECGQMFDFLRALGGMEPIDEHRTVFPNQPE